MKDLGPLHYFLGLKISQTDQGLFRSQEKYAHNLLKKFNRLECKPSSTPSAISTKLTKNSGQLLYDPTLFRQAVGSLQYLTFTRLDLAFFVNSVCQYMHSPTDSHLSAIKHILHYVKGTLNQGLLYKPSTLNLTAFCDVDWEADSVDHRSITGFVLYLNTNPIHWGTNNQPTVSRSSIEAEYRALATSAAEMTWVHILLCELHMFLFEIPTLRCDNCSAISLASNPLFHARTKHSELDYHFVREKVTEKDLVVAFVTSEEQTADIFTKSLPFTRFHSLKNKLMVVSPPISLQGHINQSKHSLASMA